MTDFRKVLADYNNVDKYALVKPNGGIERWNESVKRIWDMHRKKIFDDDRIFETDLPLLMEIADLCEKNESEKLFLSSQRARQWGGSGRGILDKNERIYNCCGSYADRPDFFGEMMYLLLCGCGVGYSLCKKHTAKMPKVKTPEVIDTVYYVEDTIEGWADLVKYIMRSYMVTGTIAKVIDYSKIREKGSLISGKFVHSGPQPLNDAIQKTIEILDQASGKRLKTIQIYDICCHLAEAVLSGGVRRSATIAIFSWDDHDMLSAKTGRVADEDEIVNGKEFKKGSYISWFDENPQRAMSNNSPMLVRDKVKIKDVQVVVDMCRNYGEPGVLFSESEDVVYNPCSEIGMIPKTIDGKSGWQFCNLVEINLGAIKTEREFYDVCACASMAATIQASYDHFPYLGMATEQIVKSSALIGVSITGYMDRKFDYTAEILATGANVVKLTNARTASLLGIMPARRCTTMKPSGNASILLQTTAASNPYHSKKYLRHVRLSRHKDMYKMLCEKAPELIVCHDEHYGTKSTGSAIVAFPIDASDAKDIGYREDFGFVESTERVAFLFDNWVCGGDRELENVTHNVSNTLTVKDSEWKLVAKQLYDLRYKIGGISLLSEFGDKVYPYAPNCSVPSKEELEEMKEKMCIRDNEVNDIIDAINNCREYNLDFFQQIDYMGERQKLYAKNLWAYETFNYIVENFSNADFYEFTKEDFENIGDQAATACAGGACQI